MFITSNGFKKLVNEAYKTGRLHVANDGEGYTISGEYWTIWIMYGWIPNKALAAIIELTGEMPGIGEGFVASKDGNQYEAAFDGHSSVMEDALESDTPIRITPLTIRYQTGQQARILQEPVYKNIMLINDKFTDMISNREIEYGKGESAAEGPFVSANGPGIFYRSDTMAMRIYPRTDDVNINLLRYLEKFDIMKAGEDDEHRLLGHGIPEAVREKEAQETQEEHP